MDLKSHGMQKNQSPGQLELVVLESHGALFTPSLSPAPKEEVDLETESGVQLHGKPNNHEGASTNNAVINGRDTVEDEIRRLVREKVKCRNALIGLAILYLMTAFILVGLVSILIVRIV